jgi:hypothetical protein
VKYFLTNGWADTLEEAKAAFKNRGGQEGAMTSQVLAYRGASSAGQVD